MLNKELEKRRRLVYLTLEQIGLFSTIIDPSGNQARCDCLGCPNALPKISKPMIYLHFEEKSPFEGARFCLNHGMGLFFRGLINKREERNNSIASS